MNKFGITETGDPVCVDDWEKKDFIEVFSTKGWEIDWAC